MTTGVVVMAYGTPRDLGDVEAYYTHVRGGRAPDPRQLADLVARYEAIGGISPLAGRTRAQVRAISAALDAVRPGDFQVSLGQKHAEPFVEEAVGELVAGGVGSIVGVVLAPHYSAGSVGQYHARAAAAAGAVPFRGIECWHLLPELTSFQARAVRRALAPMPDRTTVVFTAHSLPERALVDDPYPDQLAASAAAVADEAGLDGAGAGAGAGNGTGGWRLGWQSAGRSPEPWRGPDVLEVIAELASSGGTEGVVVVPQGFTTDHLEVLYDLDIEAASAAGAAGLAFARTRTVDDDPSVMGALAALVASAGVTGS